MARRGFQKQMSLPFQADLIEETYQRFKPKLIEWHLFQDDYKQAGNDYNWWASRFGEWMQDYRREIGDEKYLQVYQIFPRIWERYETVFTRNDYAKGVPNAALEFITGI